jgi:hypothetical protein
MTPEACVLDEAGAERTNAAMSTKPATRRTATEYCCASIGDQRLEAGQAKLEVRMTKLEDRQSRVELRLEKVEIGLEQLRDDVQQVAEGHSAIFAAMQRGFLHLEEKIDRRLAPIEAALRRTH